MENLLPKWLVSGLGGLLIAFVALGIVQKAHDINSTIKNEKPANTISVNGTGKVSARPDLATVSIGVVSQGATAAEVKDKNNQQVNKVIAFIKAQGINEKDIKTENLNLQPQYNYTNGAAPVINGYSQSQTVTVKVRNISNDASVLDKVLDGAVNNGANQIYGIYFSIEKPDDLQNQAKKMAIDDAKKKAQDLAQEAGLKLGKVVSIAESSNYPGPIMYGAPMAMGMGGGGEKSVAPDVQSGSQEISENMTVVFEIK